ncbi:transposase [Streptomyces sp. NBC_01808]|nr:transposase [Streptomyces sp. NBC_01808]
MNAPGDERIRPRRCGASTAPPTTAPRSATRSRTTGGSRRPLHILRLADEPGYRRQIKVQANRQEGRHALTRKIFHGKQGQLYQRYQDGMEDQIGALGPGSQRARTVQHQVHGRSGEPVARGRLRCP